jgi:putative peptidoglycan lipid II flippase
MFPYLFMVSLVAFAMGYLNSHHHFFAPSFFPVLLNVGMITGASLFSRWFDQPLVGLAVGVLFGGLMQMALQIPYMVRHGFKLKLSLDLKHPGLRRMLVMLGPLLFSSAVYQINLLVKPLLASMLKKEASPTFTTRIV